MNTPYIGITDFMKFEQVQKMLAVFEKYKCAGSLRQLHVGVMMSYKTLNGLPSRIQPVCPPNESIAEIFSSPETYNCLHYADYKNNSDLDKTLARAIGFGGDGINSLQLDMVWPEPKSIVKAVEASGKKIQVILQIGTNALDQVNNDPYELVRKLKSYRGIISRVLLDKSMGRGIGMNSEILLPFVHEISSSFPEIGLVVAGGLGPKTMHLVAPIVDDFPDISIDAEGRLRPSGSIAEPIDWDMAEKYLIKAFELFN